MCSSAVNRPEVLVDARGLRVVVAGADVGVAADLVALLPHHQRGLAVRLQPDDAVDDVAAGPLQRPGPLDVRLLVEARLDLDQGHDLLAGLGGVDQRVDDRGVTGRAVERLLDRQHVRVGGGLLDEALHAGGERLVRVVHEHVAVAQRREHRLRRLALGEARVGGRHERPLLQRRTVDVVDLPQRARGRAGRARAARRRRRRRSRSPAARGPASSMSSATSSRTAGPNRRRTSSRSRACSRSSSRSSSTSKSALRVTRNRWCSTTCMPGEQHRQVRGDQILQRQELRLGRGLRDHHEARHVVGHLHPGEPVGAVGAGRAPAPRGSATARRCTGTGGPGRPPAASAPGRPWSRK